MLRKNQTMLRKKNRKILIILSCVVVGMFFFGYALVPLYDVMCKSLGINGKTGGQSANASFIDESRWITVQFVATNNANLPWKFYPLTRNIKIHPGQNTKVAYFAENDSNNLMSVQAVPSVAPGLAAKYLKKTECFCFRRQTLKSKQSIEMPLLFHLDTNLPKDINTVTLSYTLFDVTNLKTRTPESKAGRIQG
jgi:cytochrome c oxidase assembly protein subunit 11